MAEIRDRRAFTCQEVLRLLDYDPETGLFRWKVRTSIRVMVGSVAGALRDGYPSISLFGRQYRAHHLAWLIMTGDWPPEDLDLDHINRDRADNRWSNLRLASRSQNCMNTGLRKDNTSGVRGVSRVARDGRWDARIRANGRTLLLGRFTSKEEAIAVRKRAEAVIFQEFSPMADAT